MAYGENLYEERMGNTTIQWKGKFYIYFISPESIFHGISLLQWPFIRWLGMQEPASVIFSIFNLISSIYMYNQFRKAVRTPFTMYWIWTVYAGVRRNTDYKLGTMLGKCLKRNI